MAETRIIRSDRRTYALEVMDHSQRFYAEVLRVFPEYRKWDRWLKENGQGLMRRMTGK